MITSNYIVTHFMAARTSVFTAHLNYRYISIFTVWIVNCIPAQFRLWQSQPLPSHSRYARSSTRACPRIHIHFVLFQKRVVKPWPHKIKYTYNLSLNRHYSKTYICYSVDAPPFSQQPLYLYSMEPSRAEVEHCCVNCMRSHTATTAAPYK